MYVPRTSGNSQGIEGPATAGRLLKMMAQVLDTLKGFPRSGDPPAGILRRLRAVASDALRSQSIGKIVKKYAGKAGFNPEEYAGHSLRSGFLTSAAMNGASIFKMMDVSRHKSVDTLRSYVRLADEFKDHAGEGLL